MAAKKPAKSSNRRNGAPPPDEVYEEQPAPTLTDTGAPIDFDGIENLQAQLGELPGEAKVNVYRMRQGIRPPFAFLYSTTAKEFTIEEVQARYGGGEFFLRAWQRGMSGALINERFSIEGEPRTPVAVAPPTPSAPGAPQFFTLPASGGGNDAIMALGNMMQRSMQQIAEIVASSRPQNNMREMIEAFTLFKSLSGDGNNPMAVLRDVMGVVKEVQPLTGEGGKADGWSLLQSLVEKVLPVIVERSAHAPPMLPNPQMQLPLAPHPQAHAPAGAAQNAGTIGDQVARATQAPGAPAPSGNATVPPQIRGFLGMLVGVAKMGGDHEPYAQMVIDQIDASPALEEPIRLFLGEPSWFARITETQPDALQYEPWFQRLRLAVLDALNAPAEPGDEEGDLTAESGEGISGSESGAYDPSRGFTQ